MKLYTEEQVRKAIEFGMNNTYNPRIKDDDFIDSLAPIELPSDEEIEKAYEFLGTWTAKEIRERSTSFHAQGARLVINRIKQQYNGN